ncbi:MAG: ferritin-like protein [Verrucomicrobiales bacterium]|nr:ferritin-like protein [Verrucomicrobiales bacterium]
MKLSTLRDLYIHELKDLYSAEKQLVRGLPKMAEAASSQELKAAFETHLLETREHVSRLERVLKLTGAGTRGPKCKGMEGLLEEGAGMIEEEADPEVRDAGLISAAQRVEHYEMAAYGCARTYARLLGETEAAGILQITLDEEGTTDKKLTDLAESVINVAANESGE